MSISASYESNNTESFLTERLGVVAFYEVLCQLLVDDAAS